MQVYYYLQHNAHTYAHHVDEKVAMSMVKGDCLQLPNDPVVYEIVKRELIFVDRIAGIRSENIQVKSLTLTLRPYSEPF